MNDWLAGAWLMLERDADMLVVPSAANIGALKAESNLANIKRMRTTINGLRQIIGKEAAPGADLLIGFNELDGD